MAEMFSGEEGSPFQKLPPEVIVGLLRFVGIKGKQNARLVCRRWRWILDHPSSRLTSFNAEISTEDSVKIILNSHLHFESLNATGVKMIWPTMTYSRNKFPSFKKVSILKDNSELTVLNLLQYGCVYTEVLSFGISAFGSLSIDTLSKVFAETKWNQLSDLSIAVELRDSLAGNFLPALTAGESQNSRENHIAGVERFLQLATVPNLRMIRFSLASFRGTEISESVVKLMSALLVFIERHSKALKGLYLFLYLSPEVLNLNTNSLGTSFSAECQESISRNLKLESLHVRVSHFDILRNLVPPCLWESDKLNKLFWLPIYLRSVTPLLPRPDAQNLIQSVIRKSCHTLVNVKILFSYGDPDPFELIWLESCTALKELSLLKFDKTLHVNTRLPTVTKLDVYTDQPNSIETGSAWIARTFPNLQSLKIFRLTTVRHGECEWLQHLLHLPKLGEIRFSFCNNSLTDFEDLVREFCRDKSRLVFTVSKSNDFPEFETVFFHIKILPVSNH